MKYKITLRQIDDEIIACLKYSDEVLNYIIKMIVEKYPSYVVDYFLEVVYKNDITTGGIKIFLGSRKKETIKETFFNLVSYVDSPSKFIKYMCNTGLIRGVKVKLIDNFTLEINDWENFIVKYGDLFLIYDKLIALYTIYIDLRKAMEYATFHMLSKIVLTKYNGWEKRRIIKSGVDFENYAEDVQNTTFAIKKSFDLFDTRKHKSFFSYATQWIKNSTKYSKFVIKDDNITTIDNTGKEVPIKFVSTDNKKIKKYLRNMVIEENNEIENELFNPIILDYFKGSLPLPNELRIISKLIKC